MIAASDSVARAMPAPSDASRPRSSTRRGARDASSTRPAPTATALWPPRLAAPPTGEELTWRESAGRGTVYAATAIHARDAEPRSIVIVELDEGFRMMSRVEGIAAEDVAHRHARARALREPTRTARGCRSSSPTEGA